MGWVYEWQGVDKPMKFIARKWYWNIGRVPLLGDFVYWIWEKTHKEIRMNIVECKRCMSDEI